MKPGLSHVLIGLAIWLVVSLVAAPFGTGAAMWFGVTATTWFYISRERRQSEEWFRSNRIPPTQWRPRAWRDIAWPVGAVLAATAIVTVANRIAGALLARAVL